MQDTEVVEELNITWLKVDGTGILSRDFLHKGQRLDLLVTQRRSTIHRGISDPVANEMTAIEAECWTLVGEVEQQRSKRPFGRFGGPVEGIQCR